jgi:mycoredoxin
LSDLYTLQPSRIILYGIDHCPDCLRARTFFAACRIPYVQVRLEEDPQAVAFVERVNRGQRCVPTIIFPDGSILVEPTTDEPGRKFEAP